MSTRAVSLKSHEESTFKDGISEYHTVDEDESGVVNDTNKFRRPDPKPEETGTSQANISKNYSESKFLELKTQIQSIFDDYNKNMGDFELFKSNFHLTMEEYKQCDSFTQVESSIEETMEHDSTESDGEIENSFSTGLFNESNEVKNIETTFYSFINNNFVNLTSDEASFDSKNNSEKTFVLHNSDVVDPCIERELSKRGTMSENNICKKIVDKSPASEKTTEPQDSEQEENSDEEKYIPIKNSLAKEDLKKKEEDKDYYKDQDTLFIFKICSYICKKIRRNPIA
ncbi:uncharacterized protein LOC121730052 [Aricia agestis]|uniref:uncharacterized protein LOC121730052 n=1 Tax=Aricia agestis TaxID=91739 RepID=UPI001C20725A|nr:uncharacterized protein LOC121730052 [Aricia agestis]